MIPPAAAVNDLPISSNSHHNVCHLEFKYCVFTNDILSNISTYYPYLSSLKLIDCDFGDYELPAASAIELPNTVIDTVDLFESYGNSVDNGLVYESTNSKSVHILLHCLCRSKFH